MRGIPTMTSQGRRRPGPRSQRLGSAWNGNMIALVVACVMGSGSACRGVVRGLHANACRGVHQRPCMGSMLRVTPESRQGCLERALLYDPAIRHFVLTLPRDEVWLTVFGEDIAGRAQRLQRLRRPPPKPLPAHGRVARRDGVGPRCHQERRHQRHPPAQPRRAATSWIPSPPRFVFSTRWCSTRRGHVYLGALSTRALTVFSGIQGFSSHCSTSTQRLQRTDVGCHVSFEDWAASIAGLVRGGLETAYSLAGSWPRPHPGASQAAGVDGEVVDR